MDNGLQQLLRTIEAKKKRLDSFRPLPPALVKNLDDWFRIELTYTSNALEGNTLSRRETATVVSEGLTVEGKTTVEHLEAENHAKAFDFVLNLLAKNTKIDQDVILGIHRIILKGIDDSNTGRYRTVGVRVAGSTVIMPNPAKVPSLMTKFSFWLQNAKIPNLVNFAAQAHYKLVSIHPFVDGNGRTARLLMNLILMQNNFPPAIIKKEERRNYLDVIERGQLGGSPNSYYQVIYQAIDRSLDIYLDTLENKKPSTAVEDDFLTVEQVAASLQVHPESVRRWVRAGKLPAIKLGGKYLRIKREDLASSLANPSKSE